MRNPRHIGLSAVLLILLGWTTARADIRPPVTFTMLGEPRAAVPGEVFTGKVRITCAESGRLEGLKILDRGWQARELVAPDQAFLDKSAAVQVDFAALCVDADEFLVMEYTWNGKPLRQSFDLSAKGVRYATEPIPVTTVEAATGDEQPLAKDPRPQPAAGAEQVSGVVKSGEKNTIRVRGRFTYTRPDGRTLGVDGMTVVIYDDDPVGRDFCADTTTDADGYFDRTFDFEDYWEDYPDIFIIFRATNAEMEIQHPTWGYVYEWETGVVRDVTGYLNIGTVQSGDESMQPALLLTSSMTRCWRWCLDYGYDPSYVEVEWPDGSEGAWYTRTSEEIHISTEREWSDATPVHEHGHHFMHNFCPVGDPDYCNGICDSGGDCGHCLWCEEDAAIAWSEGFPDYMAYVIPMQYLSRYGDAPSDTIRVESIHSCGTADYDDPQITEGYVACVLADIHNAETGTDYPENPGFADRLAMGSEEILDCVDSHNSQTVMEFLRDFRDDNPTVATALWETAANVGYDIDDENPGTPYNIYSTSHSISVPSPDPTIFMKWAKPADDASGVVGYSYTFSTVGPTMPDMLQDTDNPYCLSATLAPGSYYFSVRAVDRAGNWGDDYGSSGPYVVREPEPANLLEYAAAGWDYPLVPRSSAGASAGSVHLTATLPGDTVSTYWNVSAQNEGEEATTSGFEGKVFVDDSGFFGDDFTATAAGAKFSALNSGPFIVRGGRHVIHYEMDYGNDIAETSEDDNTWGHQFVWTPLALTEGVVVTAPAMEHMLAGWEHVHDGSTLFGNCRGYRFQNSGWWNAVVMWPLNNDDNYDLRLHLASTGATNGFTTYLEQSVRGSGRLDAIIVNRNATATAQYDAGVIFYGTYFNHGYSIVHVEEASTGFEDPQTVTLGPGRWLKLFEFYVNEDQTGPVSVVVGTSPPTAGVGVLWMSEDFIHGGLLDADAETVTGADGTAILQLDIPVTGYNGMALYRDPIDGDDDVDVDFIIRKTPPDFVPYWAAGWHSPLVPRAVADGTPTSVSLPDTLLGNVSHTYHNLAFRNASDGAADTTDVYILLDNQSHAALRYAAFPAWASSRYNYLSAQSVRGGRHTLTLSIDHYQKVLELAETNNWYGEQYVWSPLELAVGSAVVRNSPPLPIAAWGSITSGEPLWYCCDGLRISGATAWWAGMAVMPGDTCDVDLRLHAPLMGAKDGFAANLAYSSWGVNQVDYVLVNFNVADRMDYDAGVLLVKGENKYNAESVQSTFHSPAVGIHGPYAMSPNSMLQLHEFQLTPGPWTIYLKNQQGNVDWGMCLHPFDEPFVKKSETVPDGGAWLGGPGADEQMEVTITEEGFYCLAVWKSQRQDLAQAGEYEIQVYAGISGVDDPGDLPRMTALVGVYPNPFNPQTSIAFDLAQPAPVKIGIYDLKGSRITVLVDEVRPAGSHKVVWDGRDEGGRPVASGAYVVQMVTGDVRQTRKVVMIK